MIARIRDFFFGPSADDEPGAYAVQAALLDIEGEIVAAESDIASAELLLSRIEGMITHLHESSEALILESCDADANTSSLDVEQQHLVEASRNEICLSMRESLRRTVEKRDQVDSKVYELRVHVRCLEATKEMLKKQLSSIVDEEGMPAAVVIRAPPPVEIVFHSDAPR